MCDEEVKEKMDFSSSIVQKQQRQSHNLFRTLFVNFIALIVLSTSAVIFFFYRKIVDIYLKLTIGISYGGLLPTQDLLYLLPDVSKCHITTVVYVRYDKKIDMVKRIKKIVQEKIFDSPDNYPKLTSTVHEFGGYYYYSKKYQCNTNDVVKEIKPKNGPEITEEYLKEYTAKVTNAESEKNGTLLWDIHVGPFLIREKLKNVYRYPIILRFHHSIADGTSLVSLLIQVFEDKSCENYGKEIFKKLLKNPNSEKKFLSFFDWLRFNTVNLIKTTLLYLEVIFLSFGRLIEANQQRPNDINALHGTNYTGDKICAWAAEEKAECIPLVKKIKNKKKTTFFCVVATALAASLSHYFKRNNFPIPEYISGLVAVLLDYPDVDMTKPVELKNRAGGVVFEIPMIYGSTTLTNALKNVSTEWNRQIRFADAVLGRILSHHVGCIPIPLLKMHFGWTSQTYVLSNVPGGSAINTCDGWVFEKFIPVAPNALGIGVSIAILSYDEKFHIGVLVDKALVKSQEEVQKMADDVLLYIKLLDTQLQKQD